MGNDKIKALKRRRLYWFYILHGMRFKAQFVSAKYKIVYHEMAKYIIKTQNETRTITHF